MTLSAAERKALKRDYPKHWFIRVVGHGHELLLAVPREPLKKHLPIKSMPGMTIDMLHGATITLGQPGKETA